TVSFAGTASGGTTPYVYSWSFGDGSTATGQNLSHAYSSAGIYTVTLTVMDASSPQQKAIASKTVTVTIPTLAASFTFTPSLPQVNSLITFTGSGAGGVAPYTYSWVFGDGQTASGATVTHAYSTAGSFNVTLTLTDAVNTQVISSQGFTIAPVPMTANFTLSTSPTEVNVPVSFSATVTGGTPPYVSFIWNFGDGSALGSGNTPMHGYTAAGTFSVTVTVTDSAGKTGISSAQSVVVKAGLGVSTTTASPNPASTAQTVNFIATTSGGIAPVTCTWNFGDSASGTGCSTSHAYNTAGNFTAIVTVKDSLGVSISESIVVKITVAPQCTVSLAFSPATPEASSPVTFTATATNCSAPVSFVWAYGDGSAGTGITSTHIYSTGGTFSITVTATDSSSLPQIATDSRSITVVAALTVPSAMASPNPNDAGVPSNFSASTNGGVGGVSCNWTFGDGASSTGCSTTHVYSNPGTFTVVVTAQDSLGVTASKTVSEAINAQPTSSFTISPTSAVNSQPVTFAATTVGGTNPFTFSWTFGDNSSGSGNVVSHTYSVQGTYTVTLSVRDANAQTAASTQTLSVAPSPLTTSFAMTPSSGLMVGQLASFTASVSGGTSPYTFNWNFGDGTTASGNPVNHSFNMPGTYTVTVTVTDANAMTATVPAGILVNPLTLAVTISGPTTGTLGSAVTFIATGSGGTTPYTFAWTATGGSPASGTGASFSTTYSTGGTFTVSVTITDANANTSIASQSVTAIALPVTASFTVSTSPTIGVQVTFVASASGGTGGYSYSWNLGDDNTATGNPASHTYTTAGSFTVALTVTDSSMTQTTSTQIITVSPSPPAPLSTSFTMSSASAQAGQSVTFIATTSGGTSPYLYSWSFGDSSVSTGNPVSHNFTAGNYTVTLTVTDSSVPSETASASETITISTGPPTLIVTGSQAVDEGSLLTFKVSATGDPSQTITIACANCLAIGANLTQNSGFGFASGNFSWTPAEGQGPGTYLVIISASDGTMVVSANVSITVNEVAEQPVLVVPGPIHARQGESVSFMVNVTDPDWQEDNVTLAVNGLPDGA
ncbi:PKD domain-containing protein, partial [Candidatus Bathyarchaeota archaeon]